MSALQPLQTLFDAQAGVPLRLPSEVAEFYGPLHVPAYAGRPHVISDYVATMDGVISLAPQGSAAAVKMTGGTSPGQVINGADKADKAVLALVHAIADVLVVGDTGLRGNPGDVRRAERIFPPLADAFHKTRAELGKPPQLPVAVLSPEGELDPSAPFFHVPDVRVAILTRKTALPALVDLDFPPHVEMIGIPTGADGLLRAADVLAAVERFQQAEVVLCDTGPRFLAHLIAERLLDEFWLTVAPQVGGRDGSFFRPGFVDGKVFAPDDPRWARLLSVKRSGDHLLLRYGLR